MARKMANYNDVNRYLNNTICVYKGEPVFVQTMLGEPDHTNVKVYDLRKPDQRAKTVDYTSKDFDITSPPLGYMNYTENAYYVQRVPGRREKQGLCNENMIANPKITFPNGILLTKAMYECITGKHAYSYKEALENVEEGGWTACAFHRTLCIRAMDHRLVSVEYKSRVVGTKLKGNETFNLIQGDDTSFIRRILDKEGVPC